MTAAGHDEPTDDPLRLVPDGPVPASAAGARLLDLVKVQAALRAPGGCPWDAEQTHASLARHLLEETHELLEAIDAGDDASLVDELGDVLLQVTFHAQIAADEGRFDIDEVAERLVRKLIHRHPHVFSDTEVSGADEVLVNWERLKATESTGAERDPAAVDDHIPASLPALARAAKVQRRAAAHGFDWPDAPGALAGLREEIEELAAEITDGPDGPVPAERVEAEIGDVLFAAVAVARKAGVDAESALRRTIGGFASRYARFVELAAARGIDVASAPPDEVRALFREAREG